MIRKGYPRMQGVGSDFLYPTINYYVISKDDLYSISSSINNPTWFEGLTNAFANVGESIVSISFFPCKILSLYGGRRFQKISVANKYLTLPGEGQSRTLLAFDTQKGRFTMGSYTFNPIFNNYLDYEVKYSLYLPYFGYVDLHVNDILNKTIEIDYILNIMNNQLTVHLYRIEEVNTKEILIYEKTTDFGFTIPISFSNQTDINRNKTMGLISSVISVGLSVATQNPLPLLSLPSSLAKTFVTDNFGVKNSSTSGETNSFGDMFCWQKPYIIIKKPKPINTNYPSIIGQVCEKVLNFVDLNGFTKVQEMHLENFNIATKNEIDMVERLLKEGVIF